MKLTTKVINRLKYYTYCVILKTKKFKASESILIFSEARGGSTWLMELLAETFDVCINWEPLHVTRGVVPKKMNLGWKPQLPADEANPKYFKLFEKILEFKVYTKWTAKYLKRDTLQSSKHVLVKFVRANLLVSYFLENFTFKYPPIFLLRHPIDTCLSQMRAFVNHSEYSFETSIPNWVNNERFYEHKEFLATLKTPLEQKIAGWCLNNCEVINKLDTYNLYVLFYSDLVLNPRLELEKIVRFYKLDVSKERLNRINFKRGSTTAIEGEYSKSQHDQLNKNFDKLDDATKERIQHIFDHFELKLYSAHSPQPIKNSLAGNI